MRLGIPVIHSNWFVIWCSPVCILNNPHAHLQTGVRARTVVCARATLHCFVLQQPRACRMLRGSLLQVQVRHCRHQASVSRVVRSAVGTASSTASKHTSAASRPCLHHQLHPGRCIQQPNLHVTQQREVQAAAAAGAQPLPAEPYPPQGLFWRKVSALALIFLGSTINYTILQVIGGYL
jgi:hypothetical protein